MGERIPPGSYFQYPPSGVHHASPHRSTSLPSDLERYLAELFAEKHKLGPFVQVLPNCCRLLNQEIRRASACNQGLVDHERYEHESPFRSLGQHSNGRTMDLEAWSAMPTEENGHLQRRASFPAASMGWPGVPGIPITPVVKRVIRLDVPVDKYPSYNFVGRILGPRGNSLKRVEALTDCRVYIRGKGSVKDSLKEEKLKDKPGYEHLNEPLHVLVEAEFPEDIINARLEHAITILESLLKPVDESLDHYKKQQLRELALLNGTLREESPRTGWKWIIRLKVYDLVENKVQGDGNCQFRSLSDQLYDSPEHHKYVREQVIEQLKSQPQMYSSYVPMAYDDYLEKMSRSGEWGDHVTLQAAADLYGIKIFMITSFKDTCCVEILPKVLKSKNKVIYLSFWAEVHYNPVRRMS